MDLFLDFDMIDDDDHYDHYDLDLESTLSPMPRERANTWHGPPRAVRLSTTPGGGTTTDEAVDCSGPAGASAASASSSVRDQVSSGAIPGSVRKATARRNAWGNMSYADLIAKAIESSPEKRLTLAEIYSWLVENVPFFKDKGETSSSAGWKNSIRHNLSLHSRFVRVQNEGAGKSSWWTVNPEKAPCRVPRRRAATMDNSKGINQKRGRQRRSEQAGAVSSTNQSSVDVESSPPSYFPLSPEFRVRVSSNASSIGRLSPIPAAFEVDLDPIVPATTQSGVPFNQWNNPTAATDTLSECLAGILMDDLKPKLTVTSNLTLTSGLTTDSIFQQNGSYNAKFPQNFATSSHFMPLAAQVSMLGTAVPKTEAFSVSPLGSASNMQNVSMLCVGGNMSGNCGYGSTGIQLSLGQQLYKTPSVNDLLPNSHAQLHPSPPTFGEMKPGFPTAYGSNVSNSLSTTELVSPELPKLAEWSSRTDTGWPKVKDEPSETEPQTRQRSFTFSSGKLDQNSLKRLLIAKPFLRFDILKLLQTKRQQLFAAATAAAAQAPPNSGPAVQATSHAEPSDFSEQPHHSMLERLLTGDLMESSDIALFGTFGEMETRMDVTQINVSDSQDFFSNENANLPSDLDLSYLGTESTTDIECNIDQVIEHELTFGDELDFAFDPIQPNWNSNGTSGNADSITDFLS